MAASQSGLATIGTSHIPRWREKIAQFVIAIHSPMLLTFPGATIFSLDAGQIRPVTYQETDHFQITRDFLNAPERYYRHLLEEGD